MKKKVNKSDVARFNRICKDIKDVRIQGAESVAIAGVRAYSLVPSDKSFKKLLSLRATEPALGNALNYAKKFSPGAAIQHFKESKEITNELVRKLLKKGIKVFTHCHSSRVVDSIIYSYNNGKKIKEVFNTETRPLFQGRKTARELSRAGINVTTVVDAAARGQIRRASVMLIGADAILSDGSVINKIGSNMFAEIAKNDFKKKVYVVTDAWKFSKKNVKIEERNFEEIWDTGARKVRVKNPAFEKVEAKYITGIISELGVLSPKDFVKKVRKVYKWI